MLSEYQEFEAVLLDLDGTLVDTEGLSTDAINIIIKPWGKFCDWELKKKLLGLPGTAYTIKITHVTLSIT